MEVIIEVLSGDSILESLAEEVFSVIGCIKEGIRTFLYGCHSSDTIIAVSDGTSIWSEEARPLSLLVIGERDGLSSIRLAYEVASYIIGECKILSR